MSRLARPVAGAALSALAQVVCAQGAPTQGVEAPNPAAAAPPVAVIPVAPVVPVAAAVTSIQQVVIKGQVLQAAAPSFSSTVIDAQQIRDQAITQPEELLRLVPGVVVRSLSLGGVVNSITIRGFSSGAHGGDLGMVVDGIPLNEAMSHADGYADLNVVVPLEISRFQVFRGPVSALYGNFNRGGVIAIETRRGGDYAAVDASGGSFGTFDVQGVYGTALGPGELNLSGQFSRTDGFRPGFHHERGTLAARYSLKLGARTELSFSARGHHGDWDSAGNVSRAQFEGGDPYGRDVRVTGDGGLKRYQSARIDLNHQVNDELKLLSFVYGNTQDYSRFFTRPVNATAWGQREETYDRQVVGGGFNANGRLRGAVPVSYVAGIEGYRESTGFQNYEGTLDRRRVNLAAYDRTYALTSVGAFAEAEAAFTDSVSGTLGLRHDRFTGDCDVNGRETGTDPCARLNTASRTTPKLGLRWAASRAIALRASVAEGFALPPGSVKYAPGGADIAPTVFRQYELGAAVSAGRLFKGDFAAYRIDSRNEVRTIAVGVFENFGTTRRNGLDLSATLMPVTNLEINAVYNWSEAKVTGNRSAALVGKLVTGVPKESATLGLAWRPDLGLGASVETRRVGSYAVLADNSAFYPAYTTFDVGVQYTGQLPGSSASRRWRAYLKVENAGDRLYATSTGITSGQQTFNVAAPRGARAGVQIDL